MPCGTGQAAHTIAGSQGEPRKHVGVHASTCGLRKPGDFNTLGKSVFRLEFRCGRTGGQAPSILPFSGYISSRLVAATFLGLKLRNRHLGIQNVEMSSETWLVGSGPVSLPTRCPGTACSKQWHAGRTAHGVCLLRFDPPRVHPLALAWHVRRRRGAGQRIGQPFQRRTDPHAVQPGVDLIDVIGPRAVR